MKTWMKGAVLAALVVPAMAMAEEAKGPSCFDIKYSLDFLNAYPQAPSICEEVKVVDGVKYARMDATVVKQEKGVTTVAFKDVFGNKLMNLSVEAVEGSMANVGGKEVAWKDLKAGDKLSFFLPERRLDVVGQPGRGKPGAPILFKAVGE
ncbi:MAG: hypothetical protein H6R27_1867 [Proteobacteria bacterium]|nr:hypothetical protein [Pseudomonadota bacterium]